MESKSRFEGSVDSGVISKYKKALIENDTKIHKHFKKNGIRFAKVYTDEEPYLKLIKQMR